MLRPWNPANVRMPIAALCLLTLYPASMTAGAPAPTQRQAQFEILFMEGMIDHHHMAVMMAEMCVEKALHSELQQMCEDVITSQTGEIVQMQTWLSSWYGVSYSPGMPRGRMQKLDRVNGAEFEVEFMQEMIEHHSGAIREATDLLRKGYHPDLRALGVAIIQAQAPEINRMRTWLCDWYNECEA